MLALPPELATAVVAQHGIVTLNELIAAGFSHHRVRRLVTAQTLVTLHRGTYRLATSPDSFESRCVAACRADPTAVITGPAAARLWQFRHVYRPEVPIAVVLHDQTPFGHGVLLRRTNVLDPIDWAARADGMRVASPPRAWFDCARDITDERFEALTEWVLDEHCPLPALWAVTRRLDARGRPGLARVHRILSRRAAWQRPADSALELRVLNALEATGVGPLARQYPIKLPNGTLIHADGAVPSIKWAVEIDHVTWHGGRFDAQRDKGRDRNARRVGWQVDRVTDQECADNFAAVIAELADLHRIRCIEFAA
jgi:very-short-patch-repair endonuclease